MLTCCCATCVIAEDDFTRANETPVASPWVKLSGTNANLSSNVMDFPAAASYKHTTVYPGAITESQHAQVKVKLSATVLHSVELRVGMTDDNNYFSAILTYNDSGCSYLTADAFVGGTGSSCVAGPDCTDSVQVPDLTLSDWHTLEVCLQPNSGAYGYETYDKVIAKVTLADGRIFSCTSSLAGPTVGTLSGVRSTDAAQFDDFKYTYFRNSPTDSHRNCPNCNTPCAISSDDFTVDEACLWDVVTGSYTVSSGVMTMTAASSKIQHHVFHPGLKTSQIVTVDIKDTAVESRVYIGNGYLKLTYVAGTYTLGLYDNSNALLDSATDTATADSTLWLAATICYSRGVLSAQVTGHDGLDLCVDDVVVETASAYWASLGGNNGAIFDNFVFSKSYDTDEPSDAGCDTCEDCPVVCSLCLDDLTPGFMKAVLPADFANVAGSCTDCGSIAGTEVLEYDAVAGCKWIGYVPSPSCNGVVTLTILQPGSPSFDLSTPATYRLQVIVNSSEVGFAGAWYWEKDMGASPVRCTELLDEELTYVGILSLPPCGSPGNLPLYITSLV